MNITNTYKVIIIALASLPFQASAKTLEQSYIEACNKGRAVPLLVSVVAPEVDNSAAGKSVTAEFEVDRTGRPSAIRIVSSNGDGRLNAAVIDAVKDWRFRPAEVNGTAVSRTVIVPFHLVRHDDPSKFIPDFVRKAKQEG